MLYPSLFFVVVEWALFLLRLFYVGEKMAQVLTQFDTIAAISTPIGEGGKIGRAHV